MPYSGNLGKQMKRADKLNAKCVVIQGSEELERGMVILRDMTDGSQEEVPVARVIELIASRMGRE
jgi:histidyl-tRNA synthetase